MKLLFTHPRTHALTHSQILVLSLVDGPRYAAQWLSFVDDLYWIQIEDSLLSPQKWWRILHSIEEIC